VSLDQLIFTQAILKALNKAKKKGVSQEQAEKNLPTKFHRFNSSRSKTGSQKPPPPLEIRMSRKRNNYGSRLNGLIRSYTFLPFDNICVKMDGYC
jgi:hypothetical protein